MLNFSTFKTELIERNTNLELLQNELEKLGFDKFKRDTARRIFVYVPKSDRVVFLKDTVEKLKSKGAIHSFEKELTSTEGGIAFEADSIYSGLFIVFKPDLSKGLITDEHETLSAFFIALKLKNSDTSYSEDEFDNLPVESKYKISQLYKKAGPGWIHSSKNHAERMYRLLQGKQFIITQRTNSKFITNLYNRANILLKEAGQPLKADKWNPSDVWAVNPGFIGKDFKEFQSIFELNAFLQEKYKEKLIVGISLKKAAGDKATSEIFNLGRFGLGEIVFKSIGVAAPRGKLSDSMNAHVYYNQKESLTIRAFTNKGFPYGEINGKFAQGGKVGFKEMHYYLKQCYPKHKFTPKQKVESEIKKNVEKLLGDLYRKCIVLDSTLASKESEQDFIKNVLKRGRKADHYIISKFMSVEIVEAFHYMNKDSAACAIRRFVSFAASSTDVSSIFVKVK